MAGFVPFATYIAANPLDNHSSRVYDLDATTETPCCTGGDGTPTVITIGDVVDLETTLTTINNAISDLSDLIAALQAALAAATLDLEAVDDRVASLLRAGPAIHLDYDDPANTLTISGFLSISDPARTAGFTVDPEDDDLILMDSASATEVIIPALDLADWPIGRHISIKQVGAGALTVAGATGVEVVQPADALKQARAQGSVLSLVRESETVWILAGDVKPATSFAPLVHEHAIADVTGLETALAGKADATHEHPIAEVTGLQAELDALETAIASIVIPEPPETSGLTTADVETMITDALAALAGTGGGTVFDVDVSAGNVTVLEADFLASDTLNIIGATANGRQVTLPQTTGTIAVVSARTNTKSVTVKRGTASYTLAKGGFVLVYLDGSANYMKVLATSLSAHTHVAADIDDFEETTQDVVGAMIAAAGGSYDDAAGTITLPTAEGGASGTVTSVQASGGTTGFAFTGGPVTGAGTLTLAVDDAATVRSAIGFDAAVDARIGTKPATLIVQFAGKVDAERQRFRLGASAYSFLAADTNHSVTCDTPPALSTTYTLTIAGVTVTATIGAGANEGTVTLSGDITTAAKELVVGDGPATADADAEIISITLAGTRA